jgi:putative addiction module component (TIGR02574 family)
LAESVANSIGGRETSRGRYAADAAMSASGHLNDVRPVRLKRHASYRQIPTMVKIDMDSIKRLSVADRVRLVQDIWDTLQPTADESPLTEEQRRLIDQRLEDHRRDPDSAIPWEQVKARIESE